MINWSKISELYPRAFGEFHQDGNFKNTEEEFLALVIEHGEPVVGLSKDHLYDFFDERGIYIQIKCVNSDLDKSLNTFQWRVNNSSWSTELFMCRGSAEGKAFKVAFDEREKQWNKII
jgi:hypothetical protein